MTKRTVFIALGSVVVLLSSAVALALNGDVLRHELIAFASGDNLEVVIGDVSWSGLGLEARDVVATYGHEEDARFIRVNIGRLAIRPKWPTVLTGRIRFRRILVSEPQVTWIDREGGRPSKKNTGAFASPPVEIDDFRLARGTFTYVRLAGGTRAVLPVRKIGGRIDAFGTSPDRRALPIRGHLRAQLGFSGDTRVDFTVRPAKKETSADVDLHIADQNLKDLGEFFEPNVGLRVDGIMKLGHARSKLRGQKLTTSLRGIFEHLNLDLKATRERTGWTAALTNLGISLGIKRGNTEASEAEQTRTVETERGDGDSLVSFWLRGIKDAAMSVAKKPAARALTE